MLSTITCTTPTSAAFGVARIFCVVLMSFRTMCFASVRAIPAPLHKHVTHVVCARSKKQMRRIHARGVVTAVKNPQAIRDGTVGHSPRNPMCGVDALTMQNPSVPTFIARPLPEPARIRLSPNDLAPQSFLHWQRDTHSAAARFGMCPADTLLMATATHTRWLVIPYRHRSKVASLERYRKSACPRLIRKSMSSTCASKRKYSARSFVANETNRV